MFPVCKVTIKQAQYKMIQQLICCRAKGCSALPVLLLLEEGEVDAAVGAVLDEAWMLGEVVGLAMLEDKETVLLEKVAA